MEFSTLPDSCLNCYWHFGRCVQLSMANCAGMLVICISGQTKCGHGVDRTSHCQDLKKFAWLEKVSVHGHLSGGSLVRGFTCVGSLP